MSNAALKSVAGSAVVAQEKDPTSFPGMLKAFSGEIARALPKHLNADRMTRIALTCFRQTPLLAKCEPTSVFAAVIQASQLGLEPGLNGRAYLVPYKKKDGTYECQFIPGWKGLVELANRTGRASCWTGSAFKGDEFEFALGDTPYVKHRPGGEYDPALLQHTYAIGRIKGNDWPVIEVWTNARIMKHRDRFNKVGTSHYSYANWEMYSRKVPLLQVLKYLPSSPELETAIALNDTFESGERQGLTIDGALAGGYESPPGVVDTETGEVSDKPTYAQVSDGIVRARSVDELDVAADMIRGLADDSQRAELTAEVNAKRKALADQP